MEQLSGNVFAETTLRGCNHGFVTTSDGVVMIDSPQRPTDALRLKAAIESHGPLRYIINTEPHGDHWTGNAYFDVPVAAHAGVRERIFATDMAEHTARVATMGPDEARLLEGYTPNVPVITFDDTMTLHVGDHSFRMIHMPGHTPYQAAIVIEEEGVVFTSDNLFSKVHTWIQEGNPDHWLQSLEDLRDVPGDRFVPGHGPVTDKGYLDEQGSFIREWVDYVRGAVDRGMTKEEAVTNLTGLTERYPVRYPMDGGPDLAAAARIMERNVANLYDFVTGAGIHAATA